MFDIKRVSTTLVSILLILAVAGCGSTGSTAPTQPPADNPSLMPEARVNLTVAIPGIISGVFTDRLISEFARPHPGVKVSLVKLDAKIPPPPADTPQNP